MSRKRALALLDDSSDDFVTPPQMIKRNGARVQILKKDENSKENRSKAMTKKVESKKTTATEKTVVTLPSVEKKIKVMKTDPKTQQLQTEAPSESHKESVTIGRTASPSQDSSAMSSINPCDDSGTQSSVVLADCPFCSKSFHSSQERLRGSHLKSCAKSKGISARKLIEIQRLEQRQAEERRAMGLKQVQTCTIVNNKKSCAFPIDSTKSTQRSTKSSKRSKSNSSYSTNVADPHLEMALALSASLAEAKAVDELTTLGAVGAVDEESKKALLSSIQTDVLLPSASTWGCLRGDNTSAKGGRRRAMTPLEVRTDEERKKQIGLKVEQILANQATNGPNTLNVSAASNTPSSKSILDSEVLRRCQDTKASVWHMAQVQTTDETHFKSSILEKFTTATPVATVTAASTTPSIATCGSNGGDKLTRDLHLSPRMPSKQSGCDYSKPSEDEIDDSELLLDLSSAFESYLRKAVDTDLIIYVRNDREVKCHSQIMMARCKPLLSNAIVEYDESHRPKSRVLCRPDVTAEAVDLFLSFVYTGKMAALELQSTFDGLMQLAADSKLKTLLAYLSKRVNREALIDDTDDIDEWERSRSEDQSFENDDDNVQSHSSLTSQDEASKVNTKLSLSHEVADGSECVDEDVENTTVEKLDKADEDSMTSVEEETAVEVVEDAFIRDNEREDALNESDDFDPFNDNDDIEESSLLNRNDDEDIAPGEMTLHGAVPSPVYLGDDDFNDDPVDRNEMMNNSVPSPPYLGEEASNDIGLEKRLEDSLTSTSASNNLKSSKPPTPSSSTPVKVGPSKTFETPRGRPHSFVRSMSSVDVTPMPDYESLLTPELRRELHRFGLKAIPRAKAVPFLKHIYEQTHPEYESEEDDQDEVANSQSSTMESSFEECAEESIANVSLANNKAADEDEDKEDDTDLRTRVRNFIQSDCSLHTQVLLYEPFWLEDFYADFKTKTAVKAKLGEVTDVLDMLGITFRTRARARRRAPLKTKKKTPKKKRAN